MPRTRRLGRRLGLVVRLLGLWIRRDLLVVDVDGRSMEPALMPGDRLLCSRRTPIWSGAIVIRAARVGGRGDAYFIKRVLALPGHERNGLRIAPGHCWIEGDNKATSGDSRHLGPIALNELIAVAVARLTREGLIDLTR